MDFPIKNGDFPWQNVSSPEGSVVIFPWVSQRAYVMSVSFSDHPLSQAGQAGCGLWAYVCPLGSWEIELGRIYWG